MALPTNFLQNVQTYNDGVNAYLLNLFCFVNLANKKFKNFNKDYNANLGDTVTWDLPPRYTTANSLVATFQESQQRVQTLTIDQAVNTSYAFSAQQFIFNVEEYMEKFGMSATYEIGSQVEADVASLVNSNVYRFFGNGTTEINSFTQLATALEYFRAYGAAPNMTRGILPNLKVPAIIGTGLSQFVPKRNDDIAVSWDLGRFSECDWYKSNLIPEHTAGNVGEDDTTLTVVSTNDPTGANITQITCSGATVSDLDAIKKNDLAWFLDGVGSFPNLRYLTFIGHRNSGTTVQFRITADAAANGSGNVVLNIFPALSSVAGANQNILYNIVAGMQIKVLPSHRRGLIYSGNSMFLGMPTLPDEIPFPTANKIDEESGVGTRLYYGSKFGQNERGFVHDCIWGKTMQDENAFALIFPL
jgi:hypothetical protein